MSNVTLIDTDKSNAGVDRVTEGAAARFEIRRQMAPSHPRPVSFTIHGAEGFTNGNLPTRAVIPGGQHSVTVSVPTVDDNVDETNQYLSESERAGYSIIPFRTGVGHNRPHYLGKAAVAIIDNDEVAPPVAVTVSFDQGPDTPVEITEGANAVFTLNISPAQAGPLTVNYLLRCGGARKMINVPRWGAVTVPANMTTHTVTIPTHDDSEDDGGTDDKRLLCIRVQPGNGYNIKTLDRRVYVKDND